MKDADNTNLHVLRLGGHNSICTMSSLDVFIGRSSVFLGVLVGPFKKLSIFLNLDTLVYVGGFL